VDGVRVQKEIGVVEQGRLESAAAYALYSGEEDQQKPSGKKRSLLTTQEKLGLFEKRSLPCYDEEQ